MNSNEKAVDSWEQKLPEESVGNRKVRVWLLFALFWHVFLFCVDLFSPLLKMKQHLPCLICHHPRTLQSTNESKIKKSRWIYQLIKDRIQKQHKNKIMVTKEPINERNFLGGFIISKLTWKKLLMIFPQIITIIILSSYLQHKNRFKCSSAHYTTDIPSVRQC